jgi:hypothetical protein
MLGGGGEARTDYPAHIWGFVAGLAVCFCALPADRALRRCSAFVRHAAQSVLLLAALGGMVGVWLYVLL